MAMRLLWISTKLPWPPTDGGRLVQQLTLEALSKEGIEVYLLAPLPAGEPDAAALRELASWCTPHAVPVAPRGGRLFDLPSMLFAGLPLAIARHSRRELRRRCAALLDAGGFDLVHVEQLHAMAQAAPAVARGVPVVLRAQNVESDLWHAAADGLPPILRGLAHLEAARLARWEGRAVRMAARTVALTYPDADRLADLSKHGGVGVAPVTVISAPFPASLPAAKGSSLVGNPPVVILAGGDWLPNRDSRRFMLEEVWPAVRARLHGAVLHIFSDEGPDGHGGGDPAASGIVPHPAPRDSATVFAPGSVLAVPLRIASGVRMKILEAWARGIPVVATPQAAAGLEAKHGGEVLVADDAAGFAAAIARLAAEPAMRERMVAAGRAALVRNHDPACVARALAAVYGQAAAVGSSHR